MVGPVPARAPPNGTQGTVAAKGTVAARPSAASAARQRADGNSISIYHLVMTFTVRHGKSQFFIGKPSISIRVIFHGYVNLPEGNCQLIIIIRRFHIMGVPQNDKMDV